MAGLYPDFLLEAGIAHRRSMDVFLGHFSTHLEAWRIKKGQSTPARGLAARDGDWVTLVGPADEMLALDQVTPIGGGGVSLIRPRVVLG